jgi:LmbE family N-acetylglucosaminyl deacetylase
VCRSFRTPTKTIVSFHAHPDDEALLTGGTLAKAAAEGHRVVLVIATNGEAGLASQDGAGTDLGLTRTTELARAARALGCARVEYLGLPDSGWRQETTPSPATFSQLPVELAAQTVARLKTSCSSRYWTGFVDPAHRSAGLTDAKPQDGTPQRTVVRRAVALATGRGQRSPGKASAQPAVFSQASTSPDPSTLR